MLITKFCKKVQHREWHFYNPFSVLLLVDLKLFFDGFNSDEISFTPQNRHFDIQNGYFDIVGS